MKVEQLQELMKDLNDKNIIKDILENIDDESIDVYLFLKKEYVKKNVNINYLFQFVYRSFYRLDNAGLTPEFKTKYFELMSTQNCDLKNILESLLPYKTRRNLYSVQFSFATKLMNTLNPDLPIYDSRVRKILKLKGHYDKYPNNRIKKCILIYDDLKLNVDYLLKQNLKIISYFRDKFNVPKKQMNNLKILDFVLWSYGDIKK
jgi:hypothetical protein